MYRMPDDVYRIKLIETASVLEHELKCLGNPRDKERKREIEAQLEFIYKRLNGLGK